MLSKIEKILMESEAKNEIPVITLSVVESVVFKFAKGHYDDLKILNCKHDACYLTALTKLLDIAYKQPINVHKVYSTVANVYNDWVADNDKCHFIMELFKGNSNFRAYTTALIEDVIDKMLSYISLVTMIDTKYEINFNEIDPCSEFLNISK